MSDKLQYKETESVTVSLPLVYCKEYLTFTTDSSYNVRIRYSLDTISEILLT